MIDGDELRIIFQGAVRWPQVIAAQKKGKLALVRSVPEPEEPPAPPAPSSVAAAPAGPSRPDKQTILRKLRAKAG